MLTTDDESALCSQQYAWLKIISIKPNINVKNKRIVSFPVVQNKVIVFDYSFTTVTK